MNNNSNFLLSNTVQIVKGLLKNSQNSSFGDSPSLKKDEGQMNSIVQPGDKMHSIENTSIRKTISLNLETKEEFEQKKRQLLILLDQAVSMKLKISRAFPEKLKTFGDIVWKYFLFLNFNISFLINLSFISFRIDLV